MISELNLKGKFSLRILNRLIEPEESSSKALGIEPEICEVMVSFSNGNIHTTKSCQLKID